MHSKLLSLIFLAITATNVQAQTSPIVVNPETGNEVNLTRAYWNANVDLANRTLDCEWTTFDRNSGQSSQQGSTLSFRHNPLPAITPSINSALISENGVPTTSVWGLFNTARAWGVSDGIYSGPMPLHLSPFVEQIAHNSNIINAVRIWDDRYGSFICFDVSGQPLLPTGSADIANTNLVDLEGFTFEFPKALPANIEIPELYSLKTGEKIELVRGVWNYSDIANHTVSCNALGWDGDDYIGQPDSAISVYFPYNEGDGVAVSSRGQDIQNWLIDDTSMEDITLPPPRFGFEFMELTETGYRMWKNQNNEFYNCTFNSLTAVRTFGNFEREIEVDQVSPVTVLALGDNDDSAESSGGGSVGFEILMLVGLLALPQDCQSNSVSKIDRNF